MKLVQLYLICFVVKKIIQLIPRCKSHCIYKIKNQDGHILVVIYHCYLAHGVACIRYKNQLTVRQCLRKRHFSKRSKLNFSPFYIISPLQRVLYYDQSTANIAKHKKNHLANISIGNNSFVQIFLIFKYFYANCMAIGCW